MSIRESIREIIEPSRGGSMASSVFDWFITTLIMASVASVFLGTFEVSDEVNHARTVFETVASLIFTVEYLLRFWTAPRRMRYLISPMAIVDLLAILPFWIPMVLPGHILGVRALRLVRLLRILKLNRYFDAMQTITSVIASRSRELIASLFFVVLLMLVSSLLMYSAEHEAQPAVFRNAFSGLWWAVATLTTVGYGDIYPVTVLGRILGAVIAFSGIAAVAIPTGLITSGLTERLSKSRTDEVQDDELMRQRKKDAEHDRILEEHTELLRSIAEQIKRLSDNSPERTR